MFGFRKAVAVDMSPKIYPDKSPLENIVTEYNVEMVKLNLPEVNLTNSWTDLLISLMRLTLNNGKHIDLKIEEALAIEKTRRLK